MLQFSLGLFIILHNDLHFLQSACQNSTFFCFCLVRLVRICGHQWPWLHLFILLLPDGLFLVWAVSGLWDACLCLLWNLEGSYSLSITVSFEECSSLRSLRTTVCTSPSSLPEHKNTHRACIHTWGTGGVAGAVIQTQNCNKIRLRMRFICMHLCDTVCRRVWICCAVVTDKSKLFILTFEEGFILHNESAC